MHVCVCVCACDPTQHELDTAAHVLLLHVPSILWEVDIFFKHVFLRLNIKNIYIFVLMIPWE